MKESLGRVLSVGPLEQSLCQVLYYDSLQVYSTNDSCLTELFVQRLLCHHMEDIVKAALEQNKNLPPDRQEGDDKQDGQSGEFGAPACAVIVRENP